MTFEDYVADHGTRLMRLATLLCSDVYEAEDVVQEALLRAFRRWHHIASLPRPHAYIRRMVVNEAVSMHRKWGRVEAVPVDQLDSAQADSTDALDDQAVLIAAVASLPPKQRAAVVLRYFENLTDVEISQALACRTTTVRGYIHRALRTMRVDLSSNGALPQLERISQ